ncbi:MAG: glycosyltransferase family 4 protein [Desulfovibrio sp.]|nr:glycosyltransferase family 4 protein [Desulfovibrio sp.]
MSTSLAIVAPSSVPFQLGGAENFWWGLHQAFCRYTPFQVELIKLPSPEANFQELVASYKAFSELDLSHFDMVVTSKYPAWMISHRHHILYMQHTLRGLYDTYHFTGLPLTLAEYPEKLNDLMALIRKDNPSRKDLPLAFELVSRALACKSLPSELFAFPGPLIRELVHFFDRLALAPGEVFAYAAIAANVTKREDYFPTGVRPLVLHHPPHTSGFFCEKGSYIFTASRLNGTKRVELIVRAMAYVTAQVTLKISGTGPELERLKELARHDRRIEFLGYVAEDDLAGLYAHALFVPFVPYDEDYGLITIEAMKSGKPVVTTRDAGGVCELVEDGVTGLVVEPDPQALGCAFQKLLDDPVATEAMGRHALARVQEITWEKTVTKLVEHVQQGSITGKKRKILVLSSFPIGKVLFGGQRRLLAFCTSLARRFSVVLVALGGYTQLAREEQQLLPGLKQIVLPWSKQELCECERLHAEFGISLDDIGLMRTCESHTELLQTLRDHADAELIVASHPYLYPALRKALPDHLLLYDAHNVEADLKAQVLGDRAPELVGEVAEVEGACAKASSRITCCSEADGQRLVERYDLKAEALALYPNGCADTTPFTGPEERKMLRKRLGYPETKLCLFLGSEHRPNTEAALQIIAMADALPNVQFLLAGTVSTQRALRTRSLPKNVHLLGLVSEGEKNVLLKAVHLGLNPITSGSGTNLKILEYFACGLESLSTPFGLRGLQGDCLTKAHVAELADFPSAISHILAHPQSAEELADLAHYVQSHYSWQAIMDRLVELVDGILGNACAESNTALSGVERF